MTIQLPRLPDQQYRTAHRAVTRELLLRTVSQPEPARPRRRRTVMLIAAVIALLLASTGAAVAFHVFSSVKDKHDPRCYTMISREFGKTFPGATLVHLQPEPVSGDQPVDQPIAACADLWRQGVFRLDDPHVYPPGDKQYPVPHLVECVLRNGSAAVFPGPEGTCQDLGLPSAKLESPAAATGAKP